MYSKVIKVKGKLTTRMMQSFDAEATKVLLELTARSVMSPFTHIYQKMKIIALNGNKNYKLKREGVKGKKSWISVLWDINSLHVHGSWPNNRLFPMTRFLQGDHLNQ